MQVYQFEPADFFFMLLVCGGLLLAASPFLGLMLNGVPLIMALIYVWARNFPDQQVCKMCNCVRQWGLGPSPANNIQSHVGVYPSLGNRWCLLGVCWGPRGGSICPSWAGFSNTLRLVALC